MFDRDVSLFAASCTVVGVFIFLRWLNQKSDKDVGKQYPPLVPILPLFGAILRGGMSEIPKHYMKTSEKHGPVISFKMGKRCQRRSSAVLTDESNCSLRTTSISCSVGHFFSLMVVLNDYNAIYDAFVRHSEAFADRNLIWTEANVLNPELRGIIHRRYDEVFKKNHKLVLSNLKEFGFGVKNVAETRILQEVETMNDEIRKHKGRPFDPKWPLVFSTSNVMLSILFGNHFLKSLPKEHSTIVKISAECVANMDMTLNMAPFVRFLPTYWKTIDDLRSNGKTLLRAIEVGIDSTKSNKSEHTFVGRFLEIEGTNYDHRELVYILRDIIFASTDTVSTTMLWAMVELANNPEAQRRLQREIDEMVPSDRLPSLDDKQRLPYTEAVILEVMRRRTVVPILVGPTTCYLKRHQSP